MEEKNIQYIETDEDTCTSNILTKEDSISENVLQNKEILSNDTNNAENSNNKSKLKIIPLGGLEEIGMNITAFEYENSIIVVDCGISFPDENTPGVDLLIPDVTYLENNIDKVRGFFITHGHEDHIGAIPYILRKINVPIYATKLTMGIVANKLEQHKMLTKVKRKIVKFGQTVQADNFKVEFIKTNHSIQDSAALAIYTPVGIIIHTGDFKVDYTPTFGDPINLARFAELGQKGVLALMCDSTNANKPGFTMSNKYVGNVLDDLFLKYKDKRILIATFASNVDRVQQIINIAYKNGRKVAIDGKSMITIMGIATDLGYISLPNNTLIDIDELSSYEPEQTVIVTTGSQGEQMASLPRIARGKHAKIQATENDLVVFSSNPIPGNEKAVENVINEFMMRGIEVVFKDTHVSGHACVEDIKLIYSLVKPKFTIPIHGNFRQRTAQAEIAKDLGYDKEHIKFLQSGQVLEIDENDAEIVGTVPSGQIMVDGNGVGNVGNIVIKERKQLGNDGIVIITMTFMEQNTLLLSGPNIICRGFIYMRNSQELMKQMYEVVEKSLTYCIKKKLRNWDEIKEIIKMDLGDFLWDEMKAKPMILPIIMEV